MRYELFLLFETDTPLSDAEQHTFVSAATKLATRTLLGPDAADLEVSGRALAVGIRSVEPADKPQT